MVTVLQTSDVKLNPGCLLKLQPIRRFKTAFASKERGSGTGPDFCSDVLLAAGSLLVLTFPDELTGVITVGTGVG